MPLFGEMNIKFDQVLRYCTKNEIHQLDKVFIRGMRCFAIEMVIGKMFGYMNEIGKRHMERTIGGTKRKVRI